MSENYSEARKKLLEFTLNGGGSQIQIGESSPVCYFFVFLTDALKKDNLKIPLELVKNFKSQKMAMITRFR